MGVFTCYFYNFITDEQFSARVYAESQRKAKNAFHRFITRELGILHVGERYKECVCDGECDLDMAPAFIFSVTDSKIAK